MDEHEEILRDVLGGIKAKRIRKIISRYRMEDGVVSDIKEGKRYVPGRGIIHVQDVDEKILDCGHPLSLGIGHIAECEHTVCSVCVERLVLECTEENCRIKLCTVPGCSNRAVGVNGIYYCRFHGFFPLLGYFFASLFFIRTRNEEKIREYYSRRMQLRGEK